jgi:predicted Fe-Mo cluster-binding NifX family protein
MKIAVSARGATRESDVDPRFGRAAHLLLFDTETGTWDPVDNTQSLSAAHGAGIQAAETICRHGAGVLITGHVGPKAWSVLSTGGVRVYHGEGQTAADAIDAFREGRLTPLSDTGGPH